MAKKLHSDKAQARTAMLGDGIAEHAGTTARSRAPAQRGERVGYARFAPGDDNADQQLAALRQAGCDRLFEDRDSTSGSPRPGLNATLSILSEGDTLVVWRLDRLGQSLAQLVEIIDTLATKGVRFRSISEGIDTGSVGGRRIHQIMSALAESERMLISERTRAGMQRAQKKGRPIGRRPSLNEEQRREVREAVAERGEPIAEVAVRYGVHPRTIRRALAD